MSTLDWAMMASSTTALSSEQLQMVLDGPAESPPAGIVPNFKNPANLNALIALTTTLCMTFGTLAVLIRMYTKVFLIRSLAYEDCKLSSPVSLL